MQTAQLRDWQFTHSLPDQWFYQIARGPAIGPVSLDELDDIRAQNPSNDIRAHHTSQQGETPPWIEVEPSAPRTPLPAAPNAGHTHHSHAATTTDAKACPRCHRPCTPGYEHIKATGMTFYNWIVIIMGFLLTPLMPPYGLIIGALVMIYGVFARNYTNVPAWHCKSCNQTFSRFATEERTFVPETRATVTNAPAPPAADSHTLRQQ